LVCLAVGLLVPIVAFSQNAVLYEGARLIIGDASGPIENGAFVVQNGRITAIGPKGSVKAPSGAARVDLTGKTVMPTMNNVHIHAGYEGYLSWSAENHSAENLLDHMEREAFYGVGAAETMGDQPDAFAIKFQQDQIAGKFPLAARFFFAAGVAPPGGGPDLLLITGTTPLHAVHEVSTPDEAIAAVRLLASEKIAQLKIWVDKRDNSRGAHKEMPLEVVEAVVSEAHKHGIIVHAHVTQMPEQKEVVKAGVDVVVHTVANEKIDDEYIALLKEKKPYWAPVMGLGDVNELCEENNTFVDQVIPDSVIADTRAGRTPIGKYYAALSTPCSSAGPNPRAEENRKYNFSKMIESGARLVLSTDAGVSPKYSYGSAEHHEITMYARYGLSPADIIIAATSRPTEVLKIKDAGTLAKGKRADFIVLNANPLENIRNTREINSVYLYGAKLDRAELQAKFKKAVVDRDAYKAKTTKDYVPHPPSARNGSN
jgi:imidazolonepropionase-like amidohydrolase